MLRVDLLDIASHYSLEDGSVTNFVNFRLPDGRVIRALISEESARAVVQARAAQGGLPSPEPPSPSPSPISELSIPTEAPVHVQETAEGFAQIFGGDAIGEEEDSGDPWMPSSEAASPQETPPPPVVHRDVSSQVRDYRQRQVDLKKAQKRGPSPTRTVPKDEYGYPIPPKGKGGADPREIVGMGSNVDEDGVSSV